MHNCIDQNKYCHSEKYMETVKNMYVCCMNQKRWGKCFYLKKSKLYAQQTYTYITSTETYQQHFSREYELLILNQHNNPISI